MTLPDALHRRQIAPLLGAPPGTVPNFVDPISRGQDIVIASIVLSSVALAFVSVRIFVKLFITRRFGWDDVFACAALVSLFSYAFWGILWGFGALDFVVFAASLWILCDLGVGLLGMFIVLGMGN
jgi:hypothetical protein